MITTTRVESTSGTGVSCPHLCSSAGVDQENLLYYLIYHHYHSEITYHSSFSSYESYIKRIVRSLEYSELGRNVLQLVQSQPQIFQQAVLQVVNQPVDAQLLPLLPGLLHDRNPRDVVHLLPHIELTQQVHILLHRWLNKVLPVFESQLADVGQPGLEGAMIMRGKGSLDASATIVACHDDVFDFEHLDGVLDDSQYVDV